MKRLADFLSGLGRGPKRRILFRIGEKSFGPEPGPHEARMIAEAAEKRVHRRQQGWQPRVPQTWRPVEQIFYAPEGSEQIPVFRRTQRGFLVRVVPKRLAR